MQISEEAMKTLMLRSLDGDARAYRELLGMVSAQLRAYFARRLEEDGERVEALVVETLSAAHSRRVTYRRRDPFMPWIYALARYKLIQHGRTAPRPQTEDYADFMGAEAPRAM